MDISRCGMEVWGDLTLRGTGSLVANGSQCLVVRGARDEQALRARGIRRPAQQNA